MATLENAARDTNRADAPDASPKRKSLDNWSVSHAKLLRPDATFGREEIYADDPPPIESPRVSPALYAKRPEMADAAERGEYRALFAHLKDEREGGEWRAGFSEIERVLGFALPPSAREHLDWWANADSDSRPQARAWFGAGWRVAAVDLDAETVALKRWATLPKRPLSDFLALPPIHVDSWPDGFTASREEIYDDRMYPACS